MLVIKNIVEELATIIDNFFDKCICHRDCCDNCEFYGDLDGMCFLSLQLAGEIIKVVRKEKTVSNNETEKHD